MVKCYAVTYLRMAFSPGWQASIDMISTRLMELAFVIATSLVSRLMMVNWHAGWRRDGDLFEYESVGM